jgi:HEAT repeat protein
MLMVATNLQGHEDFWYVIEQFGEMETNGAAAAPALVAWSQDKDPQVRKAAMDAIIGIRKELELVLPVLLARLKDENAVTRQMAAEALGDFGKDARAALPDLLKAMDDPDPETRQAIIDAIKKIDPTALK